jgi:hypothetical protein
LSLEVRDAYGIQQNLAVLRELSEGRQSPWWLEAHTYIWTVTKFVGLYWVIFTLNFDLII